MPQMIFENLETKVQYLFPNGVIFPNIPRTGEKVSIYVPENGDEILVGIVINVHWSILDEGKDYSIFFHIRPTGR